MKEKLRRFDKGLARGEAAFTMLVLLSLVGVAAAQSLLRNIADQDVSWANDALLGMSWADPFMKKATLWLAMLGASLATHYDKHIGIDILARIATPKARAVMRGIVWLISGITSFYFARVVLGALLAKAGRIPGDYAVYNGDLDTIHICSGSAEDLGRASIERPDLFCALKGALDGLGLTVNTPDRLMDLLVPAMFIIIAGRLIVGSIGAFMRVSEGGIPDSELGGEGGAAAAAGVEVDDDHDAPIADDDSKSTNDAENVAGDDTEEASDSRESSPPAGGAKSKPPSTKKGAKQ